MAKIVQKLEMEDNASAVIGKAAKNYTDAAEKIMGSDEAMANATKEASRLKMESLTLSQKMKFAIAKEAAAGDKHQTNLVGQKEKLAKLERQLRSAIKHGDANAEGLAKQVAEQRKHVKGLEEDTDAQEKNNDVRAKATKAITALTAATTAAVAGMFLFTKHTAEHGDGLLKSSERLQMNVEAYQKLGFAMTATGTSLEEQEGALNSFTKMARDASLGTGAAASAFGLFGVELKNGDGTLKSTHQLLMDTADGFANTADSVERSAAMQDIFGESGTKLTQFLDLGSAGLAAYGEEAERVGAIMSQKAGKDAAEFTTVLGVLTATISGAGREVGENMTPALTAAMKQGVESAVKLREVWAKAWDAFGGFTKESPGIINAFAFIAKAGVGAASAIVIGWELLKTAVFKSLSAIIEAGNEFNHFVNKAREKLGLAAFDDVLNPYKVAADESAKAAEELAFATFETMAEIDKIAAAALNYSDAQKDGLTPTTEAAADATKRQAEELKKQVDATKAATDATKALEKAEKDLNERRATHLDNFVAGRAEAREANLKLHEDIVKQTQQETDTSIKSAAKMAESLGAAMGTALAAVAEGTGEVKDVFKAMAQSTVRAIQQVVSALLIKAAVNSGSSAAALGPVAAAGAASATFALLSGLIANFNDGGIVPGTGNKDTQLAMLTPGELVIPKALTSELLQVAGRTGIDRFAEGGRVGRGGAGVVVNFNDGAMVQRSPAELDRFVRDKLVPSLTRLRRQGAFT